MISHLVKLTVPNATAEQFYNFMINPSSKRYREWWPGEHIAFYITKRGDKTHVGDEVFFDEYIGESRRLAFDGVVIRTDFPKVIIWQMKKAGIRLPATLRLDLRDSPGGVKVRHELRIGYNGIGKLLDPFIKLYFNESYSEALTVHCQTEWHKLAVYLNTTKAD